MGLGGSKLGNVCSEIRCANGTVHMGSRVQSQWDESKRYHDGLWYCGTVEQCYDDGQAKIVFDNGKRWTAKAVLMYNLPPEHPGQAGKVTGGAQTMGGVPSAGGGGPPSPLPKGTVLGKPA